MDLNVYSILDDVTFGGREFHVHVVVVVVVASSTSIVCFMSELDGLPVKPRGEWIHMDQVETEKLAWMKDLPTPTTSDNKVCRQFLSSAKQIRWAYTMSATNHDGHKIYHDGHSNENVKKLMAYF